MTKGKEMIHNKTMLQIRKEKWVDNKSKENIWWDFELMNVD